MARDMATSTRLLYPSIALIAPLTLFLASQVACVPVHYDISKTLKSEPGGRTGSGDDSWDYFLFVQTSPSADCYMEEHDCSYPSNITQWTMHGIWPTLNKTLGPNYCKNVTFYPSEVQDLLPQLISQWTNVKNNTPLESFWDHEWTKHGSCASGISSMSDEHSFFKTTLGLHEKMDLNSLLERENISPSYTRKYYSDEFSKAFVNEMEVTPLLECLYSKEKGQVIYQISVCLRKDFTLMPCEQYVFDASRTKCCTDEPFLYIPKESS